MRILVKTPATENEKAHRISLHLPLWLFRLPFISNVASRGIAESANVSMDLDLPKIVRELQEYIRRNGHFDLVEVHSSDGEDVLIRV